jgi:hypothetical protein
MATAHEKLAASLEALRTLQEGGRRVFRSAQLRRADRERLIKNGFLRVVIRGWLISSSPDAAVRGDSTTWFASFWEFCHRYCEARFADQWYLSPEQSLLLHAENTTVPTQVVVFSPFGTQNTVQLPFGTSLYDVRVKKMPPAKDLLVRGDGLRVFSPTSGLIRVPEGFFLRSPIEAEVVLAMLQQDPSRLLARLLDGGHAVIAGRIAGAFRRIGQSDIADEVSSAMKAADHDVRESDPFAAERRVTLRSPSPIVGRLQALWASGRDSVLEELPAAPGLPTDLDAYLEEVDGLYEQDAYHSLSIEGYKVTPELIERVATGAWDPLTDANDRDSKNALAAFGYWLAFQRVRESVKAIISRDREPGLVVRDDHREWYREMFRPQVTVGLLEPSMLAGYRNIPVYLRGSRHVPPRWEVLREAMAAMFDLIASEPEPGVSAVLGHWLFGYIHPFPDGNGRIARFAMNSLLAFGGYAWTIIRVEERAEYLAALEAASVAGDVRPFARFITHQMSEPA